MTSARSLSLQTGIFTVHYPLYQANFGMGNRYPSPSPADGQRVQIIRVRRGADPDLIIRMPDGYHGAITASWTDFAGPQDIDPSSDAPPLLAIEGLWHIAAIVEQCRKQGRLPGGDQI